jgi:hypothetical protein
MLSAPYTSFGVRHLFKKAFDTVWGRDINTGKPFKREEAPLWMNTMTAVLFVAEVKRFHGGTYTLSKYEGADIVRFGKYATNYAQDRRANLKKADKNWSEPSPKRVEEIELAKQWRAGKFYEAYNNDMVPFVNDKGGIAMQQSDIAMSYVVRTRPPPQDNISMRR